MNASNDSINTALVDSFRSFYFPFAIDCRHLAKDSEEFDKNTRARCIIKGND